MNKIIVHIFLYLLFPMLLFSQVKYAENQEKLSMGTITYSNLDISENIGAQYGYTSNGRLAMGVLFSVSTTQRANKSAGIYLEGCLWKPSNEQTFGFNLGIAAIKNWVADQTDHLASTNGIVGNIEAYILSKDIFLSPFIQFSGNVTHFSSSSEFIPVYAFGFDIPFVNRSQPRIILTSGVAFSKYVKIMYEVDLAIVISRSKNNVASFAP